MYRLVFVMLYCRYPRIHSIFMQTTKNLIGLRGRTGLLESSMGAHNRKCVFRRSGLFGDGNITKCFMSFHLLL